MIFSVIMGAIALGSAVIGGITSAVAGWKQSKALEEQAEANAAQVAIETAQQIADIREEGAELAGTQRAMIGASGVSLKTGSPLAVLRDTQRGIQKDIKRVQQGGEFEAGQYTKQAQTYRKTRPWQLGSSLMNTVYQVGSAGATFF